MHVAISLDGVRIFGVGGERDDDADGPLQLAQVGDGFGRQRIAMVLAQVVAPVVVDREVVEAGEEGEEQPGLQHQVDGAQPAGTGRSSSYSAFAFLSVLVVYFMVSNILDSGDEENCKYNNK